MAENSTPSLGEGTDRISALTDGVIAIALTLLVLGIDVPSLASGAGREAELVQALTDLLPEIEAYLLSFVVIGFFWKQHHGMFREIARHDHLLIGMNLALLLVISFIPFLTELVGEYGDLRLPVVLFLASITLVALLQGLLWRRAMRKNFMARSVDHPAVRFMSRRIAAWTGIFALSTLLAIFAPEVAKRVYLLVLLEPLLVSRFEPEES